MVNVEEDEIVIFPSKTVHSTQQNPNNKERISISGNIVRTWLLLYICYNTVN